MCGMAPALPAVFYRFLPVQIAALFDELFGLFRHAVGHKLADVLRDLHRAELRSAHAAEMRGLGALLGQGFVVEGNGAFGIECQVELILPTEFETRLG